MAEELESTSAASAQPAWWLTMQSDYKAGMANVFILHGNTQDYVEHPRVDRSLREYLEQRLSLTHVIASFAPDQGITFPGADLVALESRKRFDQVLGVAPVAQPGAFDAAALIAAQQGPGAAQFGGQQGEDLTKLPAVQAVPLLMDYVREASTEDEGCIQGVQVGPDNERRLFPKRAAVIIERMDLIAAPDDKARLSGGAAAMLARLYRTGQDAQVNERRNLVILLSPSLEEIHPDLRLSDSGIRTIEIPVPDHEQRARYITRMLPARRVELDGLTETELTAQTAGLNRRHVEDIAMRARANGGRLTKAMVKERKDELIKAEYAEVLEVLESDVTFDMVGGHELVKAFLTTRVLPQMRDPLLRDDCPMGLLLAGPSGTGKTFLARALAHESGFTCVSMAPDNIRDQYVGGSERKLAKAIRGVKAFAPCILFVDEIDQKVKRVTGGGGGGGDSVESNIFGKLLEFFSDTSHRGSILLVAATNRPDLIDAALQRPGRIDIKAPLLPPDTARERADALAALCVRYGISSLSDAELLAIGEATPQWTQAELEGLVVAARSIGRILSLPTTEAFAEALEETAPATADIALHTRLAIAACNNRKLVPPAYRAAVGKQVAAPRPATSPSGQARARVGSDEGFADDFELE